MSALTNAQLLEMQPPPRLLTAIEKQRLFLLRQFNGPRPCPNCAEELTAFQAWGVDVDDVDLTKAIPEEAHCPECGRGLTMLVPIIGGWHWGLVPEPRR